MYFKQIWNNDSAKYNVDQTSPKRLSDVCTVNFNTWVGRYALMLNPGPSFDGGNAYM